MLNSVIKSLEQSAAQKAPRRWLFIGVLALAIAGLFSLVLVVARTPSLASIPLFSKLFHSALVVHVDLSVLLWFLAIAMMFWSIYAQKSRPIFAYIEEAAQICFISGMFFIAASPFDGNAEPLMSNYIPVITSPLFFLGLSLVLCGVCLMIFRVISANPTSKNSADIIFNFAVISSAIITLISAIAFVWSFKSLPPQIDGQQVYELGFWGGGHILQFTHTQILLLAWLMLAHELSPNFSPNKKIIFGLFSVGLLAAIASPIAYILHDVTSMDFREFFTNLMIIAGGVAPLFMAIFIMPIIWKNRSQKIQKNSVWSALTMSVVLFLYGGFLAGLIRGQNVVIPAHYHGSIVGITLGFMGVAYMLLHRLGCKDVRHSRLAFWQPFVYGGGQLLHITGLAWSGGYGVLRKTPGVANEISPSVKAAMGMMGLGGLLAIIGGFMFIIVVLKAVRKKI
jgi:hypothetical protein